jgi:FkbM family methyltransferase
MDKQEDFLRVTLFHLVPKDLESWSLSDIGLSWFTVKTRTLDCLIDTGEIVIDNLIGGIKIDVEDLEYEVLVGARKTIMKHKPPLHIEGAN